MDFFDAVKERYSYRGPYTDKPVSREELKKIVQAGLDAPSGKNEQTTEFVIVDDQETLEQIGLICKLPAVRTAKAIIFCLIDENPEKIYEGYDFQLEDCAAAVENILLAISAMGYASVWIDGWLRVQGRNQEIAKLLVVPETKKVAIMLPVGEPAEQGERKEKKSFEERVFFNKYK